MMMMMMKKKKAFNSLVVILVVVMTMGADIGFSQGGGGGGSSCSSSFFSTLVQLIPCRPSVAPFSPIPPNEVCCQAIRLLGQPCLCILINGPPISGVDRNMAIQLPDKCAANFEPCAVGK